MKIELYKVREIVEKYTLEGSVSRVCIMDSLFQLKMEAEPLTVNNICPCCGGDWVSAYSTVDGIIYSTRYTPGKVRCPLCTGIFTLTKTVESKKQDQPKPEMSANYCFNCGIKL